MSAFGIHVVEVDEMMTPRLGLFLVYFEDKLEGLTLVLALRGLRHRWFEVDWGRAAAYARTQYWVRFSWTRSVWFRTNGTSWLAWGSRADPEAPWMIKS